MSYNKHKMTCRFSINDKAHMMTNYTRPRMCGDNIAVAILKMKKHTPPHLLFVFCNIHFWFTAPQSRTLSLSQKRKNNNNNPTEEIIRDWSKMSWQLYVDEHLMCDIDGGHLTSAAIIGHDGTVWAQSATFPQVKSLFRFRFISLFRSGFISFLFLTKSCSARSIKPSVFLGFFFFF